MVKIRSSMFQLMISIQNFGSILQPTSGNWQSPLVVLRWRSKVRPKVRDTSKCCVDIISLTLKWPRYFYSRWCPRGGSMEPPWENHFPTGILQWNLHHICTGHKKSQFCKKKKLNVLPFQNGGQITDFYFVSFRFWPNFEKTLSQKNFSMKFGSKKENMNRLTLLKWKF